MFLRNIFRLTCKNHNSIFKRNISKTAVTWNNKQNEESKLKGYVMSSYLKYMTHYEQMLEKRFPSAMHIYRVFSYGIKTFYHDLKTFFSVRLLVLSVNKEEGFSELTRHEIELYDQMPKDMLKITPVLLLSALPFANYVIFPVAYMYPHKFLTSHFWTTEQKHQYEETNLKSRIQHAKPILKYLKTYSQAISDQELKAKWDRVLGSLEAGNSPTPAQLIECQMLFTVGPFSIRNLHFVHKHGLLRLHGLSLGFAHSNKLNQRAFILKEMDRAVSREGGVHEMTEKELRGACFIRGLHGCNLKKDHLTEWLEQWIMISRIVEEDSYSLLLHGPVFLALNHPSNKLLMK